MKNDCIRNGYCIRLKKAPMLRNCLSEALQAMHAVSGQWASRYAVSKDILWSEYGCKVRPSRKARQANKNLYRDLRAAFVRKARLEVEGI